MDDNNDVDVIKLFGVDDKFNCITIGLEAAKHIRLVADCFSLDDDVTDDEETDDKETDDKDDDGKSMTVDKVKYKALEKVVKFCTRCVEHPHELEQLNEFKLPISSYHLREIIPEWHADFVSKMSVAELFELFAASNYLMIDPLEKLLSVPVSILITVYDSTGELNKLIKPPEEKNMRANGGDGSRVTDKKRKGRKSAKTSGKKSKLKQQLDALIQQKLIESSKRK